MPTMNLKALVEYDRASERARRAFDQFEASATSQTKLLLEQVTRELYWEWCELAVLRRHRGNRALLDHLCEAGERHGCTLGRRPFGAFTQFALDLRRMSGGLCDGKADTCCAYPTNGERWGPLTSSRPAQSRP